MPDEKRGPVHLLDLGSRGAKWRLFAVLAVIMFVAAVVERSFDNEPGRWLAGGWLAGPQGADIDTRLERPIASGEPGSFVAEKSLPPPTGWDEALARVEDDTLFLRPQERQAWGLIESRLAETEPQGLRAQSLGEIGFTQLFQQPEAYRGQVVTIRGRVMYASRTNIGRGGEENAERIVLWIMPAGGPALPIVVYVQSLPAGFPAIERQSGGRLTKLGEDVTVHGILLKRGSYVATDGPRTAPVVLASGPEWVPDLALTGRASGTGHYAQWLWATAGAALILAIVLIGAAVRFTQPSQGQLSAAAGRLAAADFGGVSAGPPTSEALAQLERQRRA